jgi:hypothetical protein
MSQKHLNSKLFPLKKLKSKVESSRDPRRTILLSRAE